MNIVKPIATAIMILLTGVNSLPAEARTRLTKAEVQSIFIGKPWRGPYGTFHFKSDGTYTWAKKYLLSEKVHGPFRYQISPDGAIRGKSTHYRFFRTNGGGYEYLHTRSGKYWKARP